MHTPITDLQRGRRQSTIWNDRIVFDANQTRGNPRSQKSGAITTYYWMGMRKMKSEEKKHVRLLIKLIKSH